MARAGVCPPGPLVGPPGPRAGKALSPSLVVFLCLSHRVGVGVWCVQAVATAEAVAEPARRGSIVSVSDPMATATNGVAEEEAVLLRRGSSPPTVTVGPPAAAAAAVVGRAGRAGSVDSTRSARSARSTRSGPTATTATATTASVTPDDASYLSLAGWRAQRLAMAPSPSLLEAASAYPTPMNSPAGPSAVAVAPPPPSPMVLRPL
jgi:hypothetical protein